MKIQFSNKKILMSDYAPKEGLNVRRYGVNIKVNEGGSITLEDNIFNRVLLDLTCENIIAEDNVAEGKINAITRDYQAIDIEKARKLKNVLNRNKPGYGKTFEAIEECRLNGYNKILIICPKIAIPQWREQFKKWWPEVEQQIVDTPGVGDNSREIFIINYEQLAPIKRKGAKAKQEKQAWIRCKSFIWDVMIVDESHRIKNPKSATAMAIKQIPRRKSLPMTGTPILGKPSDLWSQLDLMGTFYSGRGYWDFCTRFCEIDNTFGKKPIGLTPSLNAQKLLSKALALMSVGGEDHGITEGRNHIEIPLEWDKKSKQYLTYKRVVNVALDELDFTVKNSLDQMIKLEQITTNPSKLIEGVPGIKFEWLSTWLEDTEIPKVLVFSKHVATLTAAQSYLKEKSVMFRGSMTPKQKEEAKQTFINDKNCRILFATIGSMGVAVDGLQTVCSNAVFLDRDWTPGINDQAESRLDRLLQDKMVNIWLPKVKGTVDEYIEKVVGKKEEDIRTLWKLIREYLQ